MNVINLKCSVLINIILTLFVLTIISCKEDITGPDLKKSPIQTSPANNSKNNKLVVVFRWEVLENAIEYEFQLSPNSSFDFPMQYIVGIKGTNISSDTLSYLSTYYWRIRAILNGSKTSDWSPVWIFETEKNTHPNIPTLVFPLDNSINQDLDLTLQWSCLDSNTTDQLSYDVYFSEANPPSNIVSTDQTSKAFEVGNLKYSTKYYWNIKAKDSYGNITLGPVWSFTTIANPWTSGGSISRARWTHSAVLVQNKIYIIGGDYLQGNQQYIVDAVDQYNPETSTSSVISYMPVKRTWATASGIDNQIYVAGGVDDTSGGKSELFQYDPIYNTWIQNKNMNYTSYGLSSASYNNRLYVFGGFGFPSLPMLNKTSEYNPITNVWIDKTNMPTAKFDCASVEINGKIYVVGGNKGGGTIALANLEVYDPVTNSWTTKTPMPLGLFSSAAATVNGKLYIFGGYAGTQTIYSYLISSITLEYDPVTDKWTEKTPLPTKRMGATATVYNNKIYIIGGYTGSSFLGNVDVYDPSLDQ